MNKEINDKTRAQVLREYAEEKRASEQSGPDDLTISVSEIEEDANSYDPPRPQIEPGTLCEATKLGARPHTVCGYWIVDGDDSGLALRKHDTYPDIAAEDLTNIHPVRTLGPTQVAVDVPNPEEWPAGAWAVAIALFYHGVSASVSEVAFERVDRDEARRMWEAHDGSQ